MNTTVYMGDLRYNYSGVLSIDVMPLSVADLKAVMDRDLPEVRSRIFAYPDHLWEALRSEPPDVLMLSNYVWNEALGHHFFRLAKQIKPDIFTVMGGPNIPLESERQIAYLEQHPEIDLYVLGEGDFLATEVVQHFLDSGKSVRQLGARAVPSCVYRHPDGTVVRAEMRNRELDVNKIPSPWLTGIQDDFFDGKLAPMIETNRGCPFTCTFCVQGTGWYTKVHYFDKERLFEEIEYIARRIKARSPKMGTLRIADSNYGMFERDVEISGHLGLMQRKYGWPTFIDATTGKNRPERIIKSVEQVSGALVVYQAVQSLNEDVLRNVKRSSIKLEAYRQIQIHIRGRGLRSNSDLILGLPGESLETHLDSIGKLVDSGINSIHNFQCMLLKGSELESTKSRAMFSCESRFRVLPKNFGVYGDQRIMDVEEIVVATDTMPFDDYVRARKYHVAGSVFWNDGWFEDAIRLVERLGIARSQCWRAMLPAMEQASGPVRQLLDDFVTETVRELFPTREACVRFYSSDENWERLAAGDIGDNLMYKYRARASFFTWPEISRVAMGALGDLIRAERKAGQIPGFDEFWAEFAGFEEVVHAHGTQRDEVLGPVTARLTYDIGRWLRDGSPLDVRPYRLDQPRAFYFALSEDNARDLEAALDVWGMSLKGLTKLVTRIQVAWQERQCEPMLATT
jgi:radical SAM superfamily enzyme YgiQ (UPF0313 family)